MASIDLENLESFFYTGEGQIMTLSSEYALQKHPETKSGAWKCCGIKGVNRCLSGINDFYQADFDEIPLKGYRCQEEDYDVCSRCLKADIFIQNQLLDRED